MKIALCIVGVLAVLVGIPVVSFISAYNSGNAAEKQIVAIYENNQNILAQYGQKISEAAQITEMQTEDLTKIFTDSLEARYGADGSKAGVQWIREQNPNLDQSTYRQLMSLIEAGRTEFQNGQKLLIDARRSYETSLGSLWTGFWMEKAGYPKINLAEEYKPITTARAKKAFDTGVEETMTVRPKTN